MVIPALISLSALAALVYWIRYAGNEATGWSASAIKTASTALLALIGGLVAAPWLIVLGLALGAAGDFALSRPGQRMFLAGMAAFALGHLAYGWAFFQAWPGGVLPGAFWPLALAMVALVGVNALAIAPQAGALAWPVRAYGLVIGAMALCAVLLPADDGRWLVQTGVAAFVASDLVLALRMFILKPPRTRLIAARLLWPLYWGGQALILFGWV